MTPRQIDLVQDSFALIVPRRAEVATSFYRILFDLAPHIRPLFRNDVETQGQKLMQVLTSVVRSLSNLTPLFQTIDALAERHVGYGVRNAHYAPVGRALILALREALGEAFTIETEEAWVDAYMLLSRRMMAAAREETALAA